MTGTEEHHKGGEDAGSSVRTLTQYERTHTPKSPLISTERLRGDFGARV